MNKSGQQTVGMNFRELLTQLQDRIGYHQLPVNPAATGPKDLFECCALHHELMTELVQAIYKQNGCRKLTDPVNRRDTFTALAPIRLNVLRSSKTDIDVFQLMESLCTAIDQAFDHDHGELGGARPKSLPDETQKAAVIPLANFRYRRFKPSA